jgi:hypothetical protein
MGKASNRKHRKSSLTTPPFVVEEWRQWCVRASYVSITPLFGVGYWLIQGPGPRLGAVSWALATALCGWLVLYESPLRRRSSGVRWPVAVLVALAVYGVWFSAESLVRRTSLDQVIGPEVLQIRAQLPLTTNALPVRFAVTTSKPVFDVKIVCVFEDLVDDHRSHVQGLSQVGARYAAAFAPLPAQENIECLTSAFQPAFPIVSLKVSVRLEFTIREEPGRFVVQNFFQLTDRRWTLLSSDRRRIPS